MRLSTKLKAAIVTALVATQALGAQTKIATDSAKLGRPNTNNKDFVFDLNAGAANPLIRANGGTGLLTFSNDGSTFTAFGNAAFLKQPYELSTIGLNTSVAGNALTIALKQQDGTTDPTAGTPVKIGFRSSTVTSGGFNQRSAVAATSLVVPSGATLGTVSGVTSFIYFYAIDNAGTVELAVSSFIYDEGSVVNSTTISGAATSSVTLYSTTGRTGVPVRLIGRASVNEATAGVWLTAPSELSLFPFKDQITIAARYNTSAAQSIPGAAVNTTILYDNKVYDTNSAYNTGTGVFTVPVSGKYRVTAHITFASQAFLAGEQVSLRLFKNGVHTSTLGFFQFAANTGFAPANGTDDVDCAAGDTLQIETTQSNASAKSLTNDPKDNFVSFTRWGT